MKKRGDWMDPDFNKRDSFHATIKHPLDDRRKNGPRPMRRLENLLQQGES